MNIKSGFKDIEELPSQTQLPDPFLRPDGKRIVQKKDWESLRKYWLSQILYYQYGELPPEPQGIEYKQLEENSLTNQPGYLKKILLRILTPIPIQMDLFLFLPEKKEEKLPVVVNGDLCWGQLKPEIVQEVLSRGYALTVFDRTKVAPDGPERTGIYESFPDLESGRLSAWAWTYHRVVDFLQTQKNVDSSRIAITGHSRGGKTVLLAGATDQRIALTAPNNSGCAGAGCYRYQGEKSETINDILNRFPYWFHKRFQQFVDRVDRLPFDQHILKALVAPRPLVSTEALGDLWANPKGTQMTYLAAREVYRFLNAEDCIGIWFREGKHEHNILDWQTMLDFADWHLLKKPARRDFNKLAFPDLQPIFNWRAP